MVYWILADDSDTRFDSVDELADWFEDSIAEQADYIFGDWLEDHYDAMDIWRKWRDGEDSSDLFYECESKCRDDFYD